uniref:Putative secreted protein n=1 Tax=Anopheles darlingi TaxID=43151 RepID=A0A2M4DC93_ANODA
MLLLLAQIPILLVLRLHRIGQGGREKLAPTARPRGIRPIQHGLGLDFLTILRVIFRILYRLIDRWRECTAGTHQTSGGGR